MPKWKRGVAVPLSSDDSTSKHLNKISVLYSFLALALVVSIPAIAPSNQPRDLAKRYRVGVLTLFLTDRPHIRGLRDGLKKAGYVEGKNLGLTIPDGKSARSIRAAASAYVSEGHDVIVATGNSETKIAAEMTREIPIVFLPASDPVGAGFIKSFARPGTNLTGVTYYTDSRDMTKPLELFKQVLPGLRQAVLFLDARSKTPTDSLSVDAIRRVAAHLGVWLNEVPVTRIEEAERFVSVLTKQSTHGVLVACSSLFGNLRKIGALARKKQIPLYGCSSSQVAKDGALFTYAPDMYQIGRRGAWYVDRILNGAKPADLPVETPNGFEFVINLKTAQAIGVKIPPEVLQRADKVIK